MLPAILQYLSPKNFRADTLSGLTVALALVPEAIAFAFVAGVDPIIGLYAAFMVSLITGILSGRPGMISGATGALAVVMVSLVVSHGVQYLFATVILMGIIQLLFWGFKLGKFSRIIPHTVMLGFVNGLAIIIFLAQLPQLQSSTPDGKFGWAVGEWLPLPELSLMLLLIAITMAIMHYLPKFTNKVPSALAAIIFIATITILFELPTKTVKDMLEGGSMTAGLPQFAIPQVPFSLETLYIILPYAIILALIGLIESLMTLTLIDEKTDTRGQSNKECFAQGSANIITGFFGGMGGCAMVGQSMINIQSGGRGRWSGIVAGVMLLIFILFTGKYIEKIPLAALIGVMFMVVIGTFAWSSFRVIQKIPKTDAFVLVFVSIITVFTDLAIAVISGIIISALVFSWKKSQEISATKTITPEGELKYQLEGYLFFGSVRNFSEIFIPKEDPKEVYIDFAKAKILDHSGIEAVNALTEKYKKNGKNLHLQHLSPDCKKLLKNAQCIIEVNIKEDPRYEVADNRLD